MQTDTCIKCFKPLDGQSVCPNCGCNCGAYTPRPNFLPAGLLLHNRYKVGLSLGEGGFGITYAGFDTQLKRRVAIKEFFPAGNVWRETEKSLNVTCFSSEDQRTSFENGKQKTLQEAQSIAQLDDIGAIVRVLDFFSENNTAYIIMEFVEGITLKDYVRQLPVTMSPEQITDLLLPVMEALKDMHARGFVHRDISPDNIMVTTAKGKAKLLDFGAVKAVSSKSGNSTEHPIVKRGFSPIELYSTTGLIGPWSDVYSMCATIFYLVSGQILQEPMDRMSGDNTPAVLGGKVSPQLEAVLIKGLSIRPEARYQNMDALMHDMEAAKKFAGQGPAVQNTAPVGYVIPTSQSPYASVSTSNPSYAPQQNPAYPASVQPTYTAAAPMYAQAAPGYPMNSATPAAPVNQAQSMNTTPVYPAGSAPQFPAENTSAPASPAEKKPKTKVIVGVGVGLILVLLIAAVIVMISGNNKKPSTRSYSYPVGEEKEETQAPSDTESPAIDGEVSNDPADFQFALDGKVYALPFPYSDLKQNGWEVSGDSSTKEDDTVGGNDYSTVSMKNGNKTIEVTVFNKTGNAKSVKDCQVGGIECKVKDNVTFSIANGISLETSIADIKAFFGTPKYEDDTDDDDYFTYEYGEYNKKYTFFIYKASSGMEEYSSIKLEFIDAESEEAAEVNENTPAYLAKYKAPTQAGSNVTGSVISIEGKLYQLPAPLSEFLNNGWTIKSHDGAVAAGDDSYITLSLNGKSMSVTVTNFADYLTIPENCAVSRVSIEDDDDIDVAFAGITIGTTEADLKKALGSRFSYYEGTYRNDYSCSDYEKGYSVTIYLDKDSKTVLEINLNNEKWNY